MARAGIVNGGLANDWGDPANRVVAARSPQHSMLLQRISTLDPAMRMPPLASSVLDEDAIALVTEWINSLPVRRHPLQVRVTFPRTSRAVEQSIPVSGTATGDNLQRVVYSLNGGPEVEASGVTQWSALLELQPGANSFVVYAMDADGHRSRPVRRLFSYRPQ